MSFLSETTEARGRFVGVSENVGHDMTFNILNSSTNKIINRSVVRPADDGKSTNLRALTLTSPELIKSLHHDSIPNPTETTHNEDDLTSLSKWSMHVLDLINLVRRSFFLDR